jgi:hypothetical protein
MDPAVEAEDACMSPDNEVVEPLAGDEAAAGEQTEPEEDAPAPPSPRRMGPEGKRVFAFGSSGWCVSLEAAATPGRPPCLAALGPSSCTRNPNDGGTALASLLVTLAAPRCALSARGSAQGVWGRHRTVVASLGSRSPQGRQVAGVALGRPPQRPLRLPTPPRRLLTHTPTPAARLFAYYLGVVKALKAAGLHKDAYLIASSGGASASSAAPSTARGWDLA